MIPAYFIIADEADREHLWQMQEAYMHHAHPSGTGAAPATMQQLEVYIVR